MFFKTTEARKNNPVDKQKEEGEEDTEGGEEREPCDRCGSLEHVTCNRPG